MEAIFSIEWPDGRFVYVAANSEKEALLHIVELDYLEDMYDDISLKINRVNDDEELTIVMDDYSPPMPDSGFKGDDEHYTLSATAKTWAKDSDDVEVISDSEY